jgi:signal peptidase
MSTRTGRRRAQLRLLVRTASTLLLVVVALAAAALVVPLLRGEPSRLVIVSGHSMDPTFHTGDLVLAWPDDRYRIGDVAPYRVPQGEPGEGGLVIHRIVGGNGTDGYVMQGDNNPTPDVWMPRDDDIIGRQVLLVPRVGELLAWLRQPVVLAAALAGLLTALAIGTPRRGASREETDEQAPSGTEPVIDLRAPAPDPQDAARARPRAPSGSRSPSG